MLTQTSELQEFELDGGAKHLNHKWCIPFFRGSFGLGSGLDTAGSGLGTAAGSALGTGSSGLGTAAGSGFVTAGSGLQDSGSGCTTTGSASLGT